MQHERATGESIESIPTQTVELLTANATPAEEPVLVPQPKYAQLEQKIYFWWNRTTDHIMQGAPRQYDVLKPLGYETIECNHAHEAEMWSKRLCDQDKRIAEMNDYEREMMEGPMRDNLRKEIRAKLASLEGSRNKSLNAYALKHALKMLDEQEAKAKTIRESYLHAEAYEHGH